MTAITSKPQITPAAADNLINPDVDITQLAQAVIIQAAKDAASGDYRARVWLLDEGVVKGSSDAVPCPLETTERCAAAAPTEVIAVAATAARKRTKTLTSP